jgi:TrmH family RNA methyltransferase
MKGGTPQGVISSSNRSFRLARAIVDPAGIREFGAFLVEGRRFVSEVLTRDPSLVMELLVSEGFQQAGLPAFGGRTSLVPDRLFPRIADTRNSQGIVAICRLPADDAAARLPVRGPCLVPVLDGVSDPGNAGTLIRTAAAFGCGAVVLTSGSCEAFSPKVTRASAGANVFLPLVQRVGPEEAAALLRPLGFEFVAAEAGGRPLPEEPPGGRVALVIGSEANGISPAMRAICRRGISIPMPGGMESLNAAVAGAIAMFWMSRKAER